MSLMERPRPSAGDDTDHSIHPTSANCPTQPLSPSPTPEVEMTSSTSALDIKHTSQPLSTPTAYVPCSQSTSSINMSGTNFQAQNVVIKINHSPESSEKVLQHARQQPRFRRCPPAVHVFTGREDILAQMREYFVGESKKQRVFVLYGLGGAGKTQIALRFVEICQDDSVPKFSNIYFVDASTAETIEADLRNISLAKGIGSSWEDTLDWLAGQHEQWLLLLNNADDTTFSLRKYFPPCSRGNILITSRNRNNIQHTSYRGSSRQVSEMTPEDAKILLLRISGLEECSTETDAQAMAIVKELAHFALAVVQAGAYLLRTSCGLDRYLDMYQERRGELLEEYRDMIEKLDDYQWTVYTTWEISFKRLSEQSATFLQLCAFFHHDGISEAIFQNASSNITTYVSPIPQTAPESDSVSSAKKFLGGFRALDSPWDSQKFLKMITETRSYSLIDLDSANGTYSIHPLVHAWTRTTISNIEATRACARSILGISITLGHTSKEYSFRYSLQTHINAMASGNCGGIEFSEKFGCVFKEGRRLKEAEALLTQAKDASLSILGAEHPDSLRIMSELALTYSEQGRWKEAEELLVGVKETCFRVLGLEHPDTVRRMVDLAWMYLEQRRWKELEGLLAYMEEVPRVLGADDSLPQRSMEVLAATYFEQGRWKESEELLVQINKARLNMLGADHPGTLKVTAHLAWMYFKQRRWKEAEELQFHVKETHFRVLGAQHPETLRSMEDLALMYSRQQQWKAAEQLQLYVKDICFNVLGAEHPDTLSSMENLALTYSGQGQWKEAEELQLHVKETRFNVLGAEHPYTLRIMQHLAFTYRRQSRWEEAEEPEHHVKETYFKALGAEHTDTLRSMEGLAQIYSAQARWKEAEELRRHVKETHFKVLGPEHSDTLTSMENLALTYIEQRRCKKAEELQRHVKETRYRVLGAEHLDTLRSMEILACTYVPQGRWQEAEELARHVKETYCQVLGAEHSDTLRSMENLEFVKMCIEKLNLN